MSKPDHYYLIEVPLILMDLNISETEFKLYCTLKYLEKIKSSLSFTQIRNMLKLSEDRFLHALYGLQKVIPPLSVPLIAVNNTGIVINNIFAESAAQFRGDDDLENEGGM